MLIKYVQTWYQLGLAYQATGAHYQESLECFQTAVSIFAKAGMHCHVQVALGDLFLSHLMLGSRPRHNSPESDLIKANEDLLRRSDIALLSDESTHELQ